MLAVTWPQMPRGRADIPLGARILLWGGKPSVLGRLFGESDWPSVRRSLEVPGPAVTSCARRVALEEIGLGRLIERRS